MRHPNDLNFWRAERLQHLAGKAVNKAHRCEPLSAQARHHYCRYLKLLHHAAAAWRLVDINTHDRKYERLAA